MSHDYDIHDTIPQHDCGMLCNKAENAIRVNTPCECITVTGGTTSTAGVMGNGTVVCDARAMLTRELLTFLGRCLSEWWCRSQ